MFKRAVLLLAALNFCISASALAAGVPSNPMEQPALSAKPDLAISDVVPPTLAAQCVSGQPVITFHLSINNVGDGPAPAIPDVHGIWVADNANPTISGGVALPTIAAHTGKNLDVVVNAPTPASLLQGHHTFTATVNGQHTFDETAFENNSMTFDVDVPPSLCANEALLPMQAVLPPIPTPAPSPSHIPFFQPQLPTPEPPNMSKALGEAFAKIAAPSNVNASNNPADCAKHAGLFGGLLCDGLLKAADTLPLVWDWQPCVGPGCVAKVDGYHIYRVMYGFQSGGKAFKGSRTLVETQSDPSYTVRGISPFKPTDCFVVTAYKGVNESGDSDRYCANGISLGTETQFVSQWSFYTVNENTSPIIRWTWRCGEKGQYVPLPQHTAYNDFYVGIEHFNGQIWNDLLNKWEDCSGHFEYQALLRFDLGFLNGHTVRKADLVLTVGGGSNSCADTIGAVGNWWSKAYPKHFITPYATMNLPSQEGNKITVDLKKLSGWDSGGMVLVNKANGDCLSSYDKAELTVEYFR